MGILESSLPMQFFMMLQRVPAQPSPLPWLHPSRTPPSHSAQPTHAVLQVPVLGVALAGPAQVAARTPVGREQQLLSTAQGRAGQGTPRAGAASPHSISLHHPRRLPGKKRGCAWVSGGDSKDRMLQKGFSAAALGAQRYSALSPSLVM
uniref:Uncharacterized protein n=1 Tax=Ficedula albicollis TaxID=59894 RepID=A0A803VBQ4_FICAL